MLSVFETGDASFRLANQRDEDVGWIRGSAIGFDGFASEVEAFAAAVAGRAALAEFLQRLTGTSDRLEGPTGRLHAVHDGAYEWVARGTVPLARLYRPQRDVSQRDRRRSYGIEFVLPSYVKAGTAISASQIVYRAVSRQPAADATPARSTASAAAARDPHRAGAL